MKRVNRLARHVAGALLTLAAALPGFAVAADDYPQQPIRLVVGFPPGGGVDALARVIQGPLAKELNTNVVVDNRPGAGGILATEQVAKAAGDGYTLYINSPGSFTIWPNLRKVPYDPAKDFTPISRLVVMPNVLVVNPASGISSVKDLVAKAKQQSGSLNYASGGIGTIGQIAGEEFNMLAGVKMQHIAYKGTAPALTDVMAGQVPVTFSDPTAKGMIDSGKLKALAVSSAKRSPLFPTLPTVAESGVPGYDVINWYGIVAPKGLPPEVNRKLDRAIAKVMELKDVQEALAKQGMQAMHESPAQFAAFMSAENAKWADLVKRAGIRPE
jgi:tripartite-type tricarboxylate transporter receptor subunit TctC